MILNKLDLLFGNAVVIHKPVLQFLIGTPFTFLGGAEVTEDELRSLLLVISAIIVCYVSGCKAYLCVIPFMILRVDQLGTEGGFLAHASHQQHLGLHLTAIQFWTEHQFTNATLSELQQPLGKILMVFRRLNVHKAHFHLRTFQTNINSGLIIRDFIVESGQFWHFDEMTVTLLHHNLTGYIDFVVTRFSCKNGCPRIKAVDVLCIQSMWTQILEQQVQLGQTVTDRGA